MTSVSSRPSWLKRILFGVGGLAVFLFLFVVALRVTVGNMDRGIEQSRFTGLTGTSSWDQRAMWSAGTAPPVDAARVALPWETSIARNAALLTRSPTFDRSATELHQIASAHQGYFEDLRTEAKSGAGRMLAATVSVPSTEFDATLDDLKRVGRIEAISENGEDSAIKIAAAERHVTSAQTNLSRLQKLQRERKGELRDAVALEKDIAQARETLAEAERQQDNLRSTVAQARIRVTLIEDYRAPLEANLAGAALALRNALVEGISAIFSSAAVVLGVIFEYGLPLLFWAAILFLPGRYAWRRFRRAPAAVPAAD